MILRASQVLQTGRELLQPALECHGFSWQIGNSGVSSGGDFAFGSYVRENRKMELHFRFSLGLVSYRLDDHCIEHVNYMQIVAGRNNQYPGFSVDPLDGFRHLAHDLSHFCGAFLGGPDGDFIQIVRLASAIPKGRRLP